MHVVVTDYVEPDMEFEERELRKVGITFRSHQLREAEEYDLEAAVVGAHVIVVDQSRISERVLEAANQCKLVIRHGDGYDNVDLSAATRLGIAVANKPGFWSVEVAEHALTLALTMCRGIPIQSARAFERSRSTNRKVDLSSLPVVRRIAGSVIGVIGFGKIGSRLARMACGLFDSVLVYDPYVSKTEIERIGAQSVGLSQLFAESDIISVHVPLNDETSGILGKDAFYQMKRRPIIVNAARGGVVDTDALAFALDNNLVSGAALDTTDPEPLPADHPLSSRENTLITPHLGWYSHQAMEAMRQSIVSDIVGFANGQVPGSIVNSDVLAAPQCRLAT